jgi:PiT family inorganic phosphate transporter
MRVTGLSPEQGFAAETSAATVLQLASQVGIPVSTTHTITSAIVGVGVARRWSAVRWQLVGEIALSWLFTLPATIALGFVFAFLVHALFGR